MQLDLTPQGDGARDEMAGGRPAQDQTRYIPGVDPAAAVVSRGGVVVDGCLGPADGGVYAARPAVLDVRRPERVHAEPPQAVADDRLDEISRDARQRRVGRHRVGTGWTAGAGSRSGGGGGEAGSSRGLVTGTSRGST